MEQMVSKVTFASTAGQDFLTEATRTGEHQEMAEEEGSDYCHGLAIAALAGVEDDDAYDCHDPTPEAITYPGGGVRSYLE